MCPQSTLGHRAGAIRHGLERCSAVKSTGCSTDVLNLVRRTHMAAHTRLDLQLQGIPYPTLGSASTTCMWRTDIHTSKTLRHRKQTSEKAEKETINEASLLTAVTTAISANRCMLTWH